MPLITLTTYIKAPVSIVFDLARSIDLHQQSMVHTNEKAVAGKTSGLINEGESVTWEATHLFKKRRLTSKIVSMQAPYFFKDMMVTGDFKSMEHEHHFTSIDGTTEMKDVFYYKAPFGIIGKIAEKFYLTKYLTILLQNRNYVIKIESEKASYISTMQSPV